MVQINLLPWREQTRKLQKGRFITAFVFFILVAVFLLVCFHIYYAGLLNRQMALNDYLQTQINAEQNNIDSINSKQKDKLQLEDQLNFISNMYAENYNAIRLLNEISTIIPSGLKIKSITRNANHISLDGMAPSDLAITQFMQDLSHSPLFNQPVLSIINNENGASGAERYFKIDVDEKG